MSACSTVHFDGMNHQRDFVVHLPSGYKKSQEKLPVLIVLHGNPSNGRQMKLWTGMNKTADEHGFIVVYPNALQKKWPIIPQENSVEINDFQRLINKIKKDYRADADRFYLAGISGGGIFSFQIMKELPHLFTGVIVVSGNLPRPYEHEFFEPASFMFVHGTGDYLYPGREELLSAEETLSKWISVNNCNNSPDETELPESNKKDHSSVTVFQYGCSPGYEIAFYRIKGGGHQWPNANFDANLFHGKPLGPMNKDLNTNEAIWKFMQRTSAESR